MTEPGVPSGLVVVDKPSGCTSHDVVNRVRRIFGTRKVGHAGTLDPMATGVLLVGLGKATRLLQFLQGLPKEYLARARFGVSTTTQDAEGEVVDERSCDITLEQIREAARAFEGEIDQIPPMVSAVKIGGEPLYKAARRGEVVEREARTVRVYRLEVKAYDAPAADLFVRCSSGTYIRTLAADIGDALGCGAHLTALRRLSVGNFREEDAVPLEEVGEGSLLSMRQAMRDFPVRVVNAEELDGVSHGRELPNAEPPRRLGELPVMSMKRAGDRPAHEAGMTAGVPVGIVDESGELVAVYRKGQKGLKPAAVFV